MATIRTAISVYDGVTGPLQSMRKAMDIVLNSFEAMQSASGNAVDVSAIKDAREELAKVETEFDQIEQRIKDADSAQRQFNNTIGNAAPAADALSGKLKTILATVVSIAGIKGVLGWVKENLDLSDTQRNAETQLMAVLKTVGATEDAFKSLKETAANVQSKGIYGDEIMLGGAAEFATYMTDPKAIESMMGTLANYAMGMSGGGEIDYNSMVDYATQLGKALNGTFDGLKKKGFELTDAQKEIIENGTDMEKALVLDEVISESWDGLYETMSNTPEGRIIQLKNQIGDLREGLGDRLYIAVLKVADIFEAHWPQITQIMNDAATAAGTLIEILGAIATAALDVYTFFSENWTWIEPIVWGIVAALIAYKAITRGVAIVQGILATAEGVKAAAQALATGATFAETAAQYGLNAALLACPITWIIMLIAAVVVAIYKWVQSVGGLTNAWNIAKAALLVAWNAIKVAWNGLVYGITWGVNKVLDFVDILKMAWQNAGVAIANFMGDMKVSVLTILQNMINGAIDVINGFITALNYIPGVNIGLIEKLTFATEAAAENEAAKQAREAGLADYEDQIAAAKQDRENNLAAAYQNLQDAVGELDASAAELADLYAASKAGAAGTEETGLETSWDDIYSSAGGISANTGDTAANTAAMADTLDYMEEDLAYMLDLAEREAINRYTTAEITIQQENTNYIDGDTDLDGIMDAWAADFAEKLDISGEGVD